MFAVFIAFVSVFLSGSRGGLIAVIVEFGIFAAIGCIASQRRYRLLIATLGIAVLAGLFFSWLDPGDIWKQWEVAAHSPELAMEARIKMAADALLCRAIICVTEWGWGLSRWPIPSTKPS